MDAIKELYPNSRSAYTYDGYGHSLMIFTFTPVVFNVSTGSIIDEGEFILRLHQEITKARNNG